MNLDLDPIKAREKTATSGPWEDVCLGSEGYAVRPSEGDIRERAKRTAMCGYRQWDDDKANASFIAHARSDVPALIAEVERLRATRESLALEMGRRADAAIRVKDGSLSTRADAACQLVARVYREAAELVREGADAA